MSIVACCMEKQDELDVFRPKLGPDNWIHDDLKCEGPRGVEETYHKIDFLGVEVVQRYVDTSRWGLGPDVRLETCIQPTTHTIQQNPFCNFAFLERTRNR